MRHVLKKLVPDAIAGEGFAGVLNGRVRFAALDRAHEPDSHPARRHGRARDEPA